MKTIEYINNDLEQLARKELEVAKLRLANEAKELSDRAAYARSVGEYEESVYSVIRTFELVDKIYLEEAIRNYNVNGIETEFLYKPEGLVGLKLHFASKDVSSSNLAIFDKLGQAIRYFFDLGIPLLCDAPMNFKNVILEITKDNTNDTIPAHIDGPEYLFVYTKNNLIQRAKLKKLKISVDRRIADASGFEFKGKLISSDANSLNDINVVTSHLAITGELPVNLSQWKTADNTYVGINSADDWKELVAALAAHTNKNFLLAQAKKEALLSVETQEQLNAVDDITI